jgi:DNA invertase Pin-like site-specific DNA recombinase
MNKAALLLRVSSEDQEEENQLEQCRTFAKSRNWDIVEIYRENISAWRSTDRPEKNRLMKDARQGKFNHIVVWALDRWTRKGAEALIKELNRLDQWNVQLHSVQEDFLDNFNMSGELGEIIREFLSKIVAWQAQLESKRKSERVKAAYRRKKDKGELNGWGRKKAKFNIDRAIELRVDEGLGWRSIAEKLEEDVSFMTVKRRLEPITE